MEGTAQQPSENPIGPKAVTSADDASGGLPHSPPPPAKPAKTRKPVDPDKRARDMAAKNISRRLDALKAEKDVAKLEKAIEALDKVRGAAPAEGKPAEPAPAPVAPAEPPAPPGWPSKALIAEFTPMALTGWTKAAELAKGTRYAFDAPKKVKVLGEELEINPIEQLAGGSAPLLAKYLPGAIASPEGAFLLAVAMVFGPAAIGHALELGVAWWEARPK